MTPTSPYCLTALNRHHVLQGGLGGIVGYEDVQLKS
jgi:hypothetical protein